MSNVVDHPTRRRKIAEGEAAYFIAESEARAEIAKAQGKHPLAEFLRRNAELLRRLVGL